MGSLFMGLWLVACSTAPASHASPVQAQARASVAAKAPAEGLDARRQELEALIARSQFVEARDGYLELRTRTATPEQLRWCDFRIADCGWRALASSRQPDSSALEAARQALVELVRDVKLEADKDAVWAQIHESLGDWCWTRSDMHDWGQAWPHYESALSHWARSGDIEEARRRYLDIVFRAATPTGLSEWVQGNWIGMPDEVARAAVRIAVTPQDRARAHLLRAATLQQRGSDVGSAGQVVREFESALALGREQPWYDDALYALAQWMESRGRAQRDAQGRWSWTPDYVEARRLYGRLVEEFAPGQSRWRDDALRASKRIAQVQLSVSVERHFLPGSLAAFTLRWRNLTDIELALYRLDPAVGLEGWNDGAWCAGVDLRGLERVRGWTLATGDEGLHLEAARVVRIDGELAPGAYLLTAEGAEASVREVLLVSDASLLLTLVDDRAVAWFVDVRTGAPIADAQLELWSRVHRDGRWVNSRTRAVTSAKGLAEIALDESHASSRQLLAIAHMGARVAWAQAHYWQARSNADSWRVQVLTDRPTYRPQDTVKFKLVARRRDGERYLTPAGAKLRYVVRDAQGGERQEADVTLNEFGSASAELQLDASMPLGGFQLELRDAQSSEWIASAELCQLEEYKLPEFEVSVTPLESESGVRVRCGDRVEARIRARLYSGGPVPGAKVNVVVHQAPFTVEREQPREFPWLHEEPTSHRWLRWGGGRTVVLEQTAITDDQGEAVIAFDTPYDSNSDLEYSVEARVTDASRREVVGAGRVRVGRQSHYVFARALHQLHRVGEPVEIEFESVDASGAPAPVAGVALVRRLRWFRTWFDPAGRSVSEAEYERARGVAGFDASRWREERSGYEHEQVSQHDLQLDDTGRAKLEFRAARHGCYEIEWTSRELDGAPIRAVTSVFVADESSSQLGWRRGELELILDRDTLREGEDAVLLVTSSSGIRHVLLTIESDVLHSSQVLELNGEAKLVRLALDERHVPNVFVRVQAVLDSTLHSDFEELIVPPRKQFLAVEVAPAAPDCLPGATLAWRVTTRDHAGEPVRAEVALAVFDESVVAIAGERNQDPRRFFYGEKRGRVGAVAATLMERRYAHLFERDGELSELETAQTESEGDWSLGRSDGFAAESLALAAPSASGPRGGARREAKSVALADERGAGAEFSPGELVVRSDFRATAFWQADLVTDVDGSATVEVVMPQSLTRWRASAHGCTTQTRVGLGQGRATTSLPVAVRLQAPRFFVAGDVATLSALVDNNTDVEREIVVGMERDGVAIAHADGPQARLRVAAHGQARVEWKLAFARFGPVRFRVWARAGEHSDAMERSYPVIEHGLEQLITRNGKLSAERGVVSFELPGPRRAGSSSLAITLNPNLAIALLDALPYLIDYPYGCVEQTMSRFLPTVIVAKTLRELGLDPQAALGRVFGGVEGEFAARTHPKGAKSLELLGELSHAGLARLYEFQHANGAWGWWKEGGDDRFMSAYVLWGLCLAREAGVDVRWDAAQRCAGWLDAQLVECEERPDEAAWLLHALGAFATIEKRSTTEAERIALARLWEQRDRLNGYTRALAALAAHGYSDKARAEDWVRQLVNGVQIDRTPDTSLVLRGGGGTSGYVLPTAHWGVGGASWRWSEGAVEATSTALRALLAIAPQHELVEPAVNWLVRNRRGAQWASTRDSAAAVLALAAHLRSAGAESSDCEYALRVNGVDVAVPRAAAIGALAAPSPVSVPAELLRDGRNEVELVRVRGAGPLYFALEGRCFSLEEPIRAAGSELFVRRQYYALLPRETLLSGVRYERVPLETLGVLSSGTRVEVVVTVEAKNDFEYLLLEDNKPAGFEAVDLQSGGELWASRLRADAVGSRLGGAPRTPSERLTGDREWAHRELRDQKIALFLGRLPQGVWELSYVLRAETPGEFHALPLVGQAMYVPELRANDAECAVAIE